jgi:hypothetical protein
MGDVAIFHDGFDMWMVRRRGKRVDAAILTTRFAVDSDGEVRLCPKFMMHTGGLVNELADYYATDIARAARLALRALQFATLIPMEVDKSLAMQYAITESLAAMAYYDSIRASWSKYARTPIEIDTVESEELNEEDHCASL